MTVTPSELEAMFAEIDAMQWTCGHANGSCCLECYRILADKARQLAEENLELRAALAEATMRGYSQER